MTEIIQAIPLAQIQPSRYQTRRQMNEDSVRSLADSMQQEGLIQPVTLRLAPLAGEGESPGPLYEVISGERRVLAARLLGWEAIPARVIPVVSEGEAAAKRLIENLQREVLDADEEAQALRGLHAVDPEYWTPERIAQATGRRLENWP